MFGRVESADGASGGELIVSGPNVFDPARRGFGSSLSGGWFVNGESVGSGREGHFSAIVGDGFRIEGNPPSTLPKACLESLDLGMPLLGSPGGEGSPGDA